MSMISPSTHKPRKTTLSVVLVAAKKSMRPVTGDSINVSNSSWVRFVAT